MCLECLEGKYNIFINFYITMMEYSIIFNSDYFPKLFEVKCLLGTPVQRPVSVNNPSTETSECFSFSFSFVDVRYI